MEPQKNAREETLEDLCKRADSERDLERLLDLLSKVQLLRDTQRSEKKPEAQLTHHQSGQPESSTGGNLFK
jgi:hypothetical protein